MAVGLRAYFIQTGLAVVVLLGGGGKRTQDQDIELALERTRESWLR